MHLRRARRAAFLALCLVLCAACRSASRHRALPHMPAAIVVGVSYTGSGPDANACRGVRDGYQLWAATVNRAGGIAFGTQRFPVTLTSYDDGGNALQAARNAERLIVQDGAAVLLGPCGEATTEAVATVTERYARLLIVTAPYADALLARGYRFVVDVAPTTATAGAAAASYLASLAPRPPVAVLWSDDQPSAALGQALVAATRKAGLSVNPLGAYATGSTEFSAQAAQLHDVAGAAVLIAGRPADVAALRGALVAASASPGPLIAVPSEQFDDVAAALGQAASGEALLTPWSPLAAAASEPLFGGYTKFSSAFAAANGRAPDARATLATAGGELLGAALSGTRSLDSSALLAWIARGGKLATVAGTLSLGVDSGVAAVQQSGGGALPPPASGSPAPRTTPLATPVPLASPHP